MPDTAFPGPVPSDRPVYPPTEPELSRREELRMLEEEEDMMEQELEGLSKAIEGLRNKKREVNK